MMLMTKSYQHHYIALTKNMQHLHFYSYLPPKDLTKLEIGSENEKRTLFFALQKYQNNIPVYTCIGCCEQPYCAHSRHVTSELFSDV